jgi:hypothetical protein
MPQVGRLAPGLVSGSRGSFRADGSTAARAARSPAALRSLGITTNGGYWIAPIGQTAYLTYIKFNYLDGGDWMLLLKVHNAGDITAGSSYWTNNTLQNQSDMSLTSGNWAKYGIWNTYTFNRLAMQMTNGGNDMVWPIMIFNTGRTMYNFINGNSPGAGFAGYACDSTDPAMASSNQRYDTGLSMKVGTQPSGYNQEYYIQMYGINSWGNNANQSATDQYRGSYATNSRAGAWIGCPLDEQGHTFNNSTNGGADSGLGFGGGKGNSAATWSAGYGEWANSPVDLLPGYVWIR